MGIFPKNRFIETFHDVDFSILRSPLIVVYYDPLDFPDKYVARIHDLAAEIPCGQDMSMIHYSVLSAATKCDKCGVKHSGVVIPARTNCVAVKDSLKEIHQVIPRHFVSAGRSPEDDPCIVEVWL